MTGAQKRIDQAGGILDRALGDWIDHLSHASSREWEDARQRLEYVLHRLDGLRGLVLAAISDLDRGLESLDRAAGVRASLEKRAKAAKGSERELLDGMD